MLVYFRQASTWILETAQHHRAATLGLLALSVALGAWPFLSEEAWDWRHGLWAIAALVPAAAALLIVATRAFRGLVEAKAAVDASIQASRKEIVQLRDRLAASERQIGLLRYPNAPACIVFFGHHKCGSRFFRQEVFRAVAQKTGSRLRAYQIKSPPFHYTRMDELDLHNIDFSGLGESGRDVVLFANSSERSLAKIKASAKSWKALRVIRDPRQVLVSDYFHHKGDHHTEAYGWVWDQLVHDKPILRELSEEEGLMYELDNISKGIIEEQILAPFDDSRVLTIKIEDFSRDPGAQLAKIAAFLEVPEIAGVDFANTASNPDSGPWKNHFTPRLKKKFKDRYGAALIRLGYAEDLEW